MNTTGAIQARGILGGQAPAVGLAVTRAAAAPGTTTARCPQ
jgi:hypothetical protein